MISPAAKDSSENRLKPDGAICCLGKQNVYLMGLKTGSGTSGYNNEISNGAHAAERPLTKAQFIRHCRLLIIDGRQQRATSKANPHLPKQEKLKSVKK